MIRWQYRRVLLAEAYRAAVDGDRVRMWEALRALAGLGDIRGES